ncbi:tyrosine-type recombinase/integrase [Nocardioides sp.]|uniref:tyrosine-type recombinase/integrase n=1 Tax=Nocardioides sp. TaxID=35761 RepID=UPI0039E3C207
MSEVITIWLAEREADLTTNTLRRYREAVENHILPGVGNLRVREATVPALDRFIKAKAKTAPATARQCASVLSGVMGLAVRHGAARTNPMRDVAAVTVTVKEPRALNMDEVRSIRTAVRRWQQGLPITETDGPPKRKRGRPPTQDLLDVVDLFLATGVRIGELLALRWADVDLDAGSVTISGTIIMSDAKPSRPVRQPFPKGKRGRTLLLPKFAVDTLLRRRVNMPAENVHDAVFPSTNGTWRDPGNLRKQLDRILGQIGLDWVTPHSFRKTVATVIEHDADIRQAADQLGNGVDVTERHYVPPKTTGPDARDTLQRLAPDSSNE